MPAEPLRLAMIGAGNRGAEVYGRLLAGCPDRARIAAIAEPDVRKRNGLGDDHDVPQDRRYESWETLLQGPRFCEAAIIATPDHLHVAPVLAALDQGYQILLEKPIAPDADGVREIQAAAARRPGQITVAHVLRYTPFFSAIKSIVDSGAIGRPIMIEQTENIGFWHFAHSYVRGNWARTESSSPMILAKACHDLDLVRWLAGSRCTWISSFGGLSHFRPENAPEGAPDRCTDGCPVEETCPFNAIALYADSLAGCSGWPVSVVTPDPSRAGRLAALRQGPYGRCVYRVDNSAADHQAVNLQFLGGLTAVLTVSAFTAENTRTIRIMGSHGEMAGHMGRGEIEIRPFDAGRAQSPQQGWREIAVESEGRHAGGDRAMMNAFIAGVEAVRAGSSSPSLTSLAESIESHFMAFAAETSRHTLTVVQLADQM